MTSLTGARAAAGPAPSPPALRTSSMPAVLAVARCVQATCAVPAVRDLHAPT